MNSPLVLPRVHAMLVCEEIEPDQSRTEVFNLFGVQARIEAWQFPHEQTRLLIYIQATGHAGTAPLQVRIVAGGDEEHCIYASDVQYPRFQGPLTIVHLLFAVTDCVFPSAGLYYVQAYSLEKLLNERLLELDWHRGDSNGQEAH